MKQNRTHFTGLALMSGLLLGACATVSPRAELETSFLEFGLSQERSTCLAGELEDRLERDDLVAVADFVGGLNAASSAGEALDALLTIDNPAAAGAVARATISCAF